MGLRTLLRIPVVVIVLLLASLSVPGQEMNNLKSAVVRIRNSKNAEVGTGFIIKVEKNLIYIVTASHVVRGNENPQVYIYDRQEQDPLLAKLKNREDENQKGLALLTITSNDAKTFSGLTSVSFGNSSQLDGGELVKIIGFPDGTPFWTVSSGSIARVEGNSLIFSGPIRGGNSGGPVILDNGQVIGMVTDTVESQGTSAAAKAEIIVSYVNGLVPKLISISGSAEKQQDTGIPNNEFCRTLSELLDASKSDFYSIVGAPSSSENTFHPKFLMPGAQYGWVLPKQRVYNYLLIDNAKGKVESNFYSVVSSVKGCLPKWEEKEDASSTDRFHKFRESSGARAIVVVSYTPVPQSGKYFLVLSVDIPGPGSLAW